jgi:hypothetical protein
MKFFNFRFAKVGIAIAWATVIGSTQAYNVGDYVAGAPGTYVTQGSIYDTASAAVQNSTLVTERRVVTATTEAQTNMVLSQIGDRLNPHSVPTGNSVSLLPVAGGNAGAGDQRSSIWARAGYDNLKEDNITSFGGWKANLWSFALGYDYKFNDKVLAGAALTYSNLDGSTAFNRGNIRDNAYGVVPYLAFKLSPCFDIDLMLGYSRVNKSRDRTTPGLTPNSGLSGVKATSSPRSDRYFGAVFANYKHYIQKWNLLARLGYWYGSDKQKSYNENNGAVAFDAFGNPIGSQTLKYNSLSTNLSRLSLRLQAGYKASAQIEPYAFLLYALDMGASRIKVQDAAVGNAAGIAIFNPNKQRNNNNYGGGVGLNACLHNGWTTGFEASYVRSKKFQDWGGQLRLSKKF